MILVLLMLTSPWFARDVIGVTLVPIVRDIIGNLSVGLVHLLLLINIFILYVAILAQGSSTRLFLSMIVPAALRHLAPPRQTRQLSGARRFGGFTTSPRRTRTSPRRTRTSPRRTRTSPRRSRTSPRRTRTSPRRTRTSPRRTRTSPRRTRTSPRRSRTSARSSRRSRSR